MNNRPSHLSVFFLITLLLVACTQPGGQNTPTQAPKATESAQATKAPKPTNAPKPTEPAKATDAPQATPAPSGGDASQQTDEQIKTGIQESLDTYAKAYNDNDGELLKTVVDQENVPFRRLVQTRFDTYQESIRAGTGRFSFKVNDITKRDLGFIQANILSGGGSALDWTFRYNGKSWVISEPSEAQIGKRVKTESDAFIFLTYPWADNVNPEIMKLMEQARETVKTKLGKAPDKKAEVLIKPIFSLPPPESANALAYYARGSRAGVPDRMVIFAPFSFAFGGYDPGRGWEADLEETLVHEYTHLVNNRSFTPIARMSDWMVEGLAEYVSSPDAAYNRGVPLAVQTDQIIPIEDTSGAVNKQDLQHLTILDKDVSLGYGLATALVEYIVETHGGMDGFWKLIGNYDKMQNLDKALQESFGIGLPEFEQSWHTWLKQKYG